MIRTTSAATEPGQSELYRSIDAVNQSTLKAMRISPAHYQAALNTPVAETDLMRLGSATHCCALEPERFDIDFATYPQMYTNDKGETKPWNNNATVCRKWVGDMNTKGVTVLTDTQYSLAQTAAHALRTCPQLAPLLADGEAERVLVWTNPDTGIRCKGRADWITHNDKPVILDVKTLNRAGAGSPQSYRTTAWNAGHWFQLSMYQEGLSIETGKVARLALATIEMIPPFPVRIYWLKDKWQGTAWDEYIACLNKLKECRETGEWPGPEVEHELEPPPWIMATADDMVDFGGIEMEVDDEK